MRRAGVCTRQVLIRFVVAQKFATSDDKLEELSPQLTNKHTELGKLLSSVAQAYYASEFDGGDDDDGGFDDEAFGDDDVFSAKPSVGIDIAP